MHTAYNTYLAHHTKPVPDPHQSTLGRKCHFYSAGLPPQFLVKLQFRDRLCIDPRTVPQLIISGFNSSVCRLVKLKFRDCVKHRFQSSQPQRKLHLQRRIAPGRLAVHLLAHLHVPVSATPSPALGEPNQAHPPAATAALEWKHPVAARQQL